jgi:hypothetical protein
MTLKTHSYFFQQAKLGEELMTRNTISVKPSTRKLAIGCFLICSLALVSGNVAAQGTGTLYFSTDSSPNGLYTLSTVNGQATHVGISGVTNATVGLSESGNPGLLLGGEPFGFLHINADGSGAVEINPNPVVEGLAYDPTTGIAYGWWQGSGFDSYNPATGNLIANLAGPPGNADVEGLAYANGSIYGLAGFGGPRGNLYRYNIGSNSWSFVGDTGIDFNEAGLAYDPSLNTLYAIGSQDGNLYRVNPANALTQLVGPTGLGARGGGLAFVPGIPEPTSILLWAFGLATVCALTRSNRMQRTK